MFTRWAYEDVEVMGHTFHRGDQVGLLLAAANRDPGTWDDPDRFNPARPAKPNASFGAGLHFCVGAPLARLELQIALPILFHRLPGLRLAEPPRYADVYHFHGLQPPDGRPEPDRCPTFGSGLPKYSSERRRLPRGRSLRTARHSACRSQTAAPSST